MNSLQMIQKYRIANDLLLEKGKRQEFRVFSGRLSVLSKVPVLNQLFCCFGEKVDLMEHLKKEIEELDKKINVATAEEPKPTRIGFVTFTCVSFAMQCVQALHTVHTCKKCQCTS